MTMIKTLLISYIVTIVIETCVALIWKIKDIKLLLGILLVNTITNPLTVTLVYLAGINMRPVYSTVFEYGMEVAVFGIEAILYARVLKLKHPVLVSLSLNAASYGTGLIINWLFKMLLN